MTTDPAPRAPRAVTCDLWHTLLEVRPGSERGLASARERAWVRPLVAMGRSEPDALRAVRTMRAEAERMQSTGRSVPIRAQARLLRSLTGTTVDAGAVAESIGTAALATPVRIAPGAVVALRGLARQGARLGLVSNILSEPPEAIRTILARAGLDRWFAAVYLSAEHRYAKPSPRPFRSVLEDLDASPAEAVHIGDHSDDVRGAIAAGVPVIRFTGMLAGYPTEPDDALARVPPGVPSFADWQELRERWPKLLEAARGALRGGRIVPARRARSARAG
ncbi:MAG TPA: HAD family hydrolase [Thermoplasmata archaeon]|nr:HAD family hydrolase [Thermoplasmata archaeon]